MPLKRLGLSLETSFISIYKPLLNFALLFKLLADAAQKFPLEFREESCEKCQHTPLPPSNFFRSTLAVRSILKKFLVGSNSTVKGKITNSSHTVKGEFLWFDRITNAC